tara:strand:+ start:196 stop:369 length:174 start_codon:yes stop_codon:yes gene_type:complete
MHQLGVMHYLGDGTTTTTEDDATGEAVRWFIYPALKPYTQPEHVPGPNTNPSPNPNS